MSVSSYQTCLHFTFYYNLAINPTLASMRNCYILFKKTTSLKVGPACLDLLRFMLHNDSFKQYNNDWYIQSALWLRGHTWNCGARCQQFDSKVRLRFLSLLFCFVVAFLLFWCKKHNLSWHVAIPFAILFNLLYLTYCTVCKQLNVYQHIDIASLNIIFFDV